MRAGAETALLALGAVASVHRVHGGEAEAGWEPGPEGLGRGLQLQTGFRHLPSAQIRH